MRKILASFLAAAMVASIGATMSFAATAAGATFSTNSVFTGPAGAEVTYGTVILDLDENGTDTEEPFQLSETIDIVIPNGSTAADANLLIAKGLNGLKFKDVEYNGKFYTVTLKQNGTNAQSVIATFSPAVNIGDVTNAVFTLTLPNAGGNVVLSGTLGSGSGGETQDADRNGTFDNMPVAEVVKAYGDGTPIPLTETSIGVDKDLNDQGGIQSGNTIYFMLRDDVIPKLSDDTYWKLKVTKGDNGKYIKSVKDVTKIFKNDLYDANTGKAVLGTGDGDRHRYIKVELNEIYTDDEYKMSLDMRISAKSKAVDAELMVGNTRVTDDSEIKVNDFTFYMKNIVKDADNDWKVGIGGLMLNPLENDWNEVTYYDEDGDLAFMKFFADSDVDKFYAKLSTKWEHADYASYFNDQDAFIFNFTGSPKLSSTSRADLEIYNPFVDEDGNERIDPTTAVIYQVIDGDLYDVTDSFEYKEGNNGDMAYCTRTRFLGTYIICEKAVEEAVADETVPEELTPDTTAPEEVTPDTTNTGKTPANTGKYL